MCCFVVVTSPFLSGSWKCFPHYWPFVRGIHWWPVDSPHNTTVMYNFDVFLVVSLNKLFNKQSIYWWFEMLMCCHCNGPVENLPQSVPSSCQFTSHTPHKPLLLPTSRTNPLLLEQHYKLLGCLGNVVRTLDDLLSHDLAVHLTLTSDLVALLL